MISAYPKLNAMLLEPWEKWVEFEEHSKSGEFSLGKKLHAYACMYACAGTYMQAHMGTYTHTHSHVYVPACEYVIVRVNTLGMQRLVFEFLGVSSNPAPHSLIMFMMFD